MRNISNIRVSIIGAARSGVAAARLCKKLGGIPFVSDAAVISGRSDSERKLIEAGIEYELGSHSQRALDCDIMVLSPGVPSNADIVQKAIHERVHVVSEIEFASWFFEGAIIAVTGSNGKTTTTSLIGNIFKYSDISHFVAGNIGYAFSEGVLDNPSASYAILEVSSFQLDHIDTFKPFVSVITNISPDHLDRYNGQYSEYIASKRRIYKNQSQTEYLVVNGDDVSVDEYSVSAQATRFTCSLAGPVRPGAWLMGGNMFVQPPNMEAQSVAQVESLQLKGPHNHMNALQAISAATLCGVNLETVRDGVVEFKGVEHRLELVRTVNGVSWYNDSKATNVDSTITALKSFSGGVILIAGGKDKGAPYDPLRPLIAERVKQVIVIGEAADIIEEAFNDVVDVQRAESLQAAVQLANEMSQSGDTVLLSPACASFDMFDNYEQRGEVFKNEVNKLS